MKIRYKQTDFPFHYPFTISGGRTKTRQPALFIELEFQGVLGFGEAPSISYYNIPVEKMIADLEEKLEEIEAFSFQHPNDFHAYLLKLFPENSFLICALDMAAWDVFGKQQNQLLHELWETPWTNLPLSDYTIGLDSVEKMLQKMEEKPWPIYKIKLGSSNDIDLIRELRKQTAVPFRIDANGGWTLDEAISNIPILKALGVELIEQPLEKYDFESMNILIQKSSVPLFADESCVSEADVVKCAGCFDGINIKLTKCGGITPALRMIEQARKLGLKVMMGTMNESIVGTAAIAQFLPQLDYADLDGPLLLKGENASGLQQINGLVHIDGKSGLGIHAKF
jgi:L-alanine-DL-glutamate epimerase-like enolase superfamily enzyme